MNGMLGDYIDKFALVYLDDILMYNKSADKHESHKAKHSKFEFAHSHVKYVGHVVGSSEWRVDLDKVSAVADWAAPRDIKGV